MIKLMQGDCLERMKEIPDGSVDLILTDPPYGMNYQSARRTDKDKWKPKIANDKSPFIWWINEAMRVVKDGGCVVSFCRFDSWSAFEYAFKMAGFCVKAEIVWDKMTHGTGDLRGCPGFRHEIAIFATKGRFAFGNGRPQSLISIPRISPSKLMHPNEKPVELMDWLIRYYAPSEGVVLDPFTGVSPVGVAAVRNNRKFIGIELDLDYFNIALNRVEEEKGLNHE